MRPTHPEAYRQVAADADALARTYPSQYYDFVRWMGLERAMTLIGSDQEPGWAYQTYQDLVLDLGVPRQQLITHGPRMRLKQCYTNAFQLLHQLGEDYLYVEGYARATLLVTHHAWVEHVDGTVIDPTWSSLDITDVPFTYFGVRFSHEFTMLRALQTKHYSILEADWRQDNAALRFGFTTDADGVVIDGRLK